MLKNSQKYLLRHMALTIGGEGGSPTSPDRKQADKFPDFNLAKKSRTKV